MTDEDELLTSALEAMPIFPLRGVVLLPGSLLSLHVFEPRYRAMLADCLATNRCLAMALIPRDARDLAHEGLEAQPNIARVAGAGIIVRHMALPDGRSNIVLQGWARVALDELPFVEPYRRARARLLKDLETPVSAGDRAALYAVASAFAAASRRSDFALEPGIDLGAAADLCAHHLIPDAQARQRTLEELDVAARVRWVTATLAEQMGLLNPESRGKPN